jgi:eukaryotic-like serine/threonine-protein kinase
MIAEQLGPYRMGRPLGRGGMGAVYEGTNVETDELAAVKVLSAALATEPDFRQRFAVEIETLRKLYHPNIVQLFGFGEQDGVLFYAMELVDGSSLEEELRRGRVFTWREVAEIGIQTCRALRHAHDRGIIHRDIKPANLLLTKDGKVKLSDFGIARLFGFSRVTAVGNVLGTVEYMAPEQADARPVTPRTDLYSLGGVLYCLLTRRTPFQAQSLGEMLQKHRSAQPEPIHRFAPSVPAEMELIVYQLLAKDPGKRIANATLVARRLEAMVRGLSVIPNTLENQQMRRLRQESESVDAAGPGAAPPPSQEMPETRLLTGAESPPPDPRMPTRAAGQGSEEELPETAADPELWIFGSGATGPDAGPHLYPLPMGGGTNDALPKGEGIRHVLPKGEGVEGDPLNGEGTKRAGRGVTPETSPTSADRFVAVAEEELDRQEAEPQRHTWLHTWVLAGTLLATGLTVWYLLQPPSAETLYARISAAAAEGKIEYATTDIDEFLHRYSDDTRSREVWQYQRAIELDDMKRRLELRARTEGGRQRLLPIEIACLDAIHESAQDSRRALAKLQALVVLYRDKSDLPERAGECLELARRQIEQLRQRPEKGNGNSLAELDERLKHADDLQPTDPDAARTVRQAIIELYQDKPWAADAVQQARKALETEAAKRETRKG